MEEKIVNINPTNTTNIPSNSFNSGGVIIAQKQNSGSTLKTFQINLPPADQEKYVLEKVDSDLTNPKMTNVDIEKICGYNPYMKEIFSRVTCVICTMIPYDPLECKNCNAVVCKFCIEKWNKKECIVRCGGESYDTPSRILRDIINGIVIKCKNSNKGCLEELRIERLRIHEAECDFDDVKCPFSDCKYTSIRKLMLVHIDQCEFNKIKCKYCKNLYKKLDFENHLNVQCEEILVECDKCQKSEHRKNFPLHNCIYALKEEIRDMQKTISNLIENNDNIKLNNDELKRTLDDEKKGFNERNSLMTLLISLLKSTYENDDIRFKPHNLHNPIQIPYIFRFMTSSRTLQITNLAEYTYSKINLNIQFEIPTSHQSIVTSSKRIFIVGGVNHEKKTYEFDIMHKTLIERAEMNVGRRRHILTELRNGIFLATGGSNQNEEVLRDCEAYILSKNKWEKISSLNIPRFYHTAFSFNSNFLYVIGGCNTSHSSLVNLNTIERIELNYDLSGSWEILGIKDLNFLKARSRLSYLFIANDKILLFGGIPDHQAVFFDLTKQEIFLADNQYNIEGRFFFNDRCTWQNETLFISSQSTRCIFNHNSNCWEFKDFTEDNN